VRGADDDSVRLDVELDILAQPRLPEDPLGNAQTSRVADADDPGFDYHPSLQ